MIDSVAERFHRRKDFDLVDFSEVGLPIYLVTLDVLTLAHKRIPPIKEFTMRAIQVGLGSRKDIGGVLGLDEPVIAGALNQLRDEQQVDYRASDGSAVLLARGRQTLLDNAETTPEEETLTIAFDGLLRKPVWLAGEQLFRPNDIDRQKVVEIRPYPAIPPERDDLSLVDINHVLQQQYGSRTEFGRDILCVKRVVRRTRMFRLAIGLAYRAKRGSDVLVSFVIDGAPDEDLERAFAEKGGPKKMGFIQAINDSTSATRLRRHLGKEITALLPPEQDYRGVKDLVAGARLGFEIASKRCEQDPSDAQQHRREDAVSRLHEAEQALRGFPARPLAPYEFPRLLTHALSATREMLMISSSTVSAHIVNKPFLRSVENLLKKGVQVRLLLEQSLDGEKETTQKAAVLAELEKLRQKYPQFSAGVANHAGFFHLVKDHDYAAISNIPWLSGRSKARTFHVTNGYILQSKALVDAYVARLIAAPKGSPRSRK